MAAGLAAAAGWPALHWGGHEALRSLLLGAGMSWFAVLASYVGLSLAFRDRRSPMLLAVGGFVVRLAVLFGLLAVVVRAFDVRLDQLVLWLVGFYVVLVIAEAVLLTRGGKAPPARR